MRTLAEIRPFRGYRYHLQSADSLGNYVSPPYDMLDAEMIDMLYETDPLNVVRIIQNRRENTDSANKDRHARAAKLLDSWIAQGSIVREARESFYVYRQQFAVDVGAGPATYERTGLTVLVKLVDFSEGIVCPHENTLSGPKADRYELMQATRANTGQIFGLVPDDGDLHSAIAGLVKAAACGRFTDRQGVSHELYRTDDKGTIARLQELVAGRTILIADGHHRYETALKYAREVGTPEAGHVMMTLVSMADPGLVIRPFHRVVKKCALSAAFSSVRDLAPFFDIEELGEASMKQVHDFMHASSPAEMLFVESFGKRAYALTTAAAGRKYLVKNTAGMSPLWNALVVSRINRLCVEAVMRQPLDGAVLHDVMDYVNDAEAALRTAVSGDGYVGCFFIRPLDISAVRDIVSAGERMPQKSTNFYPKLYSGLVFNRLDVV